jgi:hypothetical protein
MAILYYHDPRTGDYLSADWSSRDYYLGQGQDLVEARVPALEGEAASISTCGVSREYLRKCRRVAKADVPRDWLKWINPEDYPDMGPGPEDAWIDGLTIGAWAGQP